MNVLDMTIIRLAAGLVLLIAANIALGSINAIIDGEWDQTKFRNGCIKSAVVDAAPTALPSGEGKEDHTAPEEE